MTGEYNRQKLYTLARMGAYVLILAVLLLAMRGARSAIETRSVRPLLQSAYGLFYPTYSSEGTMIAVSQIEELESLRSENKALREELGSIPGKADLLPARVIWIAGSHYTLAIAQSNKTSLIQTGTPVVYRDVLLGTVVRFSDTMAIVRSVHDSGYHSKGKTENGVQGELIGDFGQELAFVFPVEKNVTVGERVYAVYPDKGWQFLVGSIESISSDRSRPTREAQIITAQYDPREPVVFLSL